VALISPIGMSPEVRFTMIYSFEKSHKSLPPYSS
jgi:hypothetical protein